MLLDFAMADAEDVPEWETERRKRCINHFVKMKCVKKGHEELDADDEDIDMSLLDEEKMRTLYQF